MSNRTALARAALRNIGKASIGRCPTCDRRTVFVLVNSAFPREGYLCLWCRSLPRNRLVALGLREVLDVPTLGKARRDGLNSDVYIAAAYGPLLKALPVGLPRVRTSDLIPDTPLGAVLPDGHSTCQDLQHLTYDDASLDVVVTEDVFEHVRDPAACFAEVARVLRLGGSHVFTVPYRPDRPTLTRVDTTGPEDVMLMEPEWHGDVIRGRILAYRTFGYDIFDQLSTHGFETRLLLPTLGNRSAGIHNTTAFVATKVA